MPYRGACKGGDEGDDGGREVAWARGQQAAWDRWVKGQWAPLKSMAPELYHVAAPLYRS